MDSRSAGVRRCGAGGRPPARPRRMGRALDRVVPREAGGRGVVSAAEILPVPPPEGPRPAALRADRRQRHAGEGGARSGRDDALRRGELERDRDRLDLRRPRHLQEVQGARRRGEGAALARRPARVLDRGAEGGLAARLPRAGGGGPRRRGAAALLAAEGGARRRRPARDPAARGAEALPRARGADARGPGSRISSACSRRWTTSSCACRWRSCARSGARFAPPTSR